MCSPFRVSKLPQDVISCCSLRLHFRDVSAVAKCSVKSNSQVDWGWSICSSFFPHHDMFSCLFAFLFLRWNTHVCLWSGLARK